MVLPPSVLFGSDKSFMVFFAITELLGLLSVSLAIAWSQKYMGGFAWGHSTKKFNWHPVLMTIGMVFLQGNALIIYRLLRRSEKFLVKTMHTLIHIGSIIMMVVGLTAVFEFHNQYNIPNLYSMHSWVGLGTVILFGSQFVLGFTVYLFPKVSQSERSNFMPIHRFLGVLIFIFTIVASLTGIMEKLGFLNSANPGHPYSQLPAYGVMGNVLALTILMFAVGVVYLVVNPFYKRHEIDESINQRIDR